MIRRTVLTLVIGAALSLCSVPAAMGAYVVAFNDNFQGYTAGGALPSGSGSFTGTAGDRWQVTTDPGASAIVTSTPNQAVALTRVGGNSVAIFGFMTPANATLTTNALVHVSAQVKTTSNVGSFISVLGYKGAGPNFTLGNGSFDVRFKDDGTVWYGTGIDSSSVLSTGLTHTPGQFNSVTVLVDFAAGNYDLIVNSVQANNLTFSTTAINPGSMSNLIFTTNAASATGEVDSALVVIPEPATMATLAFGGLALTLRRKRQ